MNKQEISKRFFVCYSDLSRLELAEKFGVTRQTVDQWATFIRPVPWERLKALVDERSINWDWLIDGHGEKYRKHISVEANLELDKAAINARFLSCFEGMTKKELAEKLEVTRHFINALFTNRKQVPWETMRHAILSENVTWEWLIEGRDRKYRR